MHAQHFDDLKTLLKEREALKSTYDKLVEQSKNAKRGKLSVDLQPALDKLFEKDQQIAQEISKTELTVSKVLEEVSVVKKETGRTSIIRKNDPSQGKLIDSLSEALVTLQGKHDSLLSGSVTGNSYVQTLQNELRNVTGEKSVVQNELDQIRTDKFILARRNMILLYFNVGVAILLLGALVFTLLSFRKRKTRLPSQEDLPVFKPRPVTGFSSSVPRIAMDAYDSKLEKIEMLGKLREKGLLTDEEFMAQKQQLLLTKNNS